jgi:MFS family permease
MEAVNLSEFDAARLRKARAAVSLLFFLNGTLFASWVSRIPLVQQRLELSHAVLGAALLAAAAGAVVTMPVAGIFNGKVGSERLATWWVIPYAISLPLLALAPNVYALVAGLFFFGCGHGALDVGMNAQAVAVDRRYPRTVMSSFHAMFSAGGLVGAAFGALMAWLKVEPVWHFALASGALGAIGFFGCRYLLPGVDRVVKAEGESVFVLPPKALIPLGIVAVAVLMGEGAMADWTGVYLHKVVLSSEAMAAAGYAAFSVAMAAGRFSGDRLVGRFGSVNLVRASGLMAAAGMVLALATGSAWLSLAGFILVGTGCSTVVPCVFTAAGRVPGVPTGVALAAVTTMGYFGFLIGPPLIGFVAQGVGLKGALSLLILTNLIVAGLAPALRTKR